MLSPRLQYPWALAWLIAAARTCEDAGKGSQRGSQHASSTELYPPTAVIKGSVWLIRQRSSDSLCMTLIKIMSRHSQGCAQYIPSGVKPCSGVCPVYTLRCEALRFTHQRLCQTVLPLRHPSGPIRTDDPTAAGRIPQLPAQAHGHHPWSYLVGGVAVRGASGALCQQREEPPGDEALSGGGLPGAFPGEAVCEGCAEGSRETVRSADWETASPKYMLGVLYAAVM